MGIDSTETAVLESKITATTFSDFQSLESAIDTLKSGLENSGYIESEMVAFSKSSDSSYLAQFELNTLYEKIIVNNIENLKSFGITKRELENISLNSTSNEMTIDFKNIQTVLKYLNSRLSEMGDPFVILELENLMPSKEFKNTLLANLTITSQKKRNVTAIQIKGYENFPRAFLRYSIGLKEGMLFQQQKINQQSLLLENLGFVKNTKPPEVLFTNQATEVYLYLEKVPNNNFDGILGFATNEETNKIELNGYLNLVLSNNLNFGEELNIQYRNDGNLQEQFEVALELPYLFKSPVGMEMGLSLFKQDSTFSIVEKNILTTYRFDTKTKVFAGYKDYESTNLLDEQQAGGFIQDYMSQFFVFGGGYVNSQNSLLFPYKSQVLLKNELGKRETANSVTPQYKVDLKVNHIFNLNSINSFYLNNNTRFLSSENYLTNELFRFGGINSIRGFDENSIEASLVSVLNTEYRFLLNLNTYLHSIIDIAYFENDILDLKSQIYSFGFGMGLRTNAGIFKFELANGTFEGQDFEFSNTKLQISLKSRF
ncbi:MAG: hypothetical protein NXH73_11080 [Flavobacteriaceae bacterium]|nr:hypothetical protein [Flavobacteriaceae bacterium]